MQKCNLKLLVFDWDGTLADSAHVIVAVMQKAIKQSGLDFRSDSDIRNVIGLGLPEAARYLYPDRDKSEHRTLIENYRLHFIQSATGNTRLFPEVREILDYLNDHGYLMAIATGKSRRGLERSLKETCLDPYFVASRCADEVFSKPHPQMLNEIMDILDVRPAETLMIGDSEYDLEMANNANVSGIAVTYGAQSVEHLLKYKPLTCINRIGELPEWIEKLN